MRKLRWALGLDPGGASASSVRAVERGIRVVVGELAEQERERSERLASAAPPWMRADVLVYASLVWRVRRRIAERLRRIGVAPEEVSWPWADRPIEMMVAHGKCEDVVSVGLIDRCGRQLHPIVEHFFISPTNEATVVSRVAEHLWKGMGCWETSRELEARGVTDDGIEALRQGVKRRMSPETARVVYDVLVLECGASDDARERFVRHVSGVLEWGEWRIGGALGFGGKLWEEQRRGPWVSCYREDETTERLAMIERANAAIAALWAAAQSETTPT